MRIISLVLVFAAASLALGDETKPQVKRQTASEFGYDTSPLRGITISEAISANGTLIGKMQDGDVTCYYVHVNDLKVGSGLQCLKEKK